MDKIYLLLLLLLLPPFLYQYLVGVVSFLFRVPTEPQRKAVLPYHVIIGITLFFMALFTVETGIVEKETLMKRSGSLAPICSSAYNYSELPGVSSSSSSGGGGG